MRFSLKALQAAQFVIKQPKAQHPFPPLPTVSELVKLYKVRATKHLSQNFLYDPAIVDRFVRCFSKNLQSCYACEVGPGPGSITRAILQHEVEHLTVVEKDNRFLPILQYVADVVDKRLSIVHGDILKFDVVDAFPSHLAKQWHEGCPPFCVFGNLPFNISLPLLFQWLDMISRKVGMFTLGRIPFILTFQLEVAERLVAGPGNPQRSRLSVTTQYLCDVEYKFNINGGAFIPRPKVDVGVVKITPKREFDINLPFQTVDRVVKHVLTGQKNKPCKFGISTLFPPQRKDLVDEIFRTSGVLPEKRSIALENNEFRDLCYVFEKIAVRIPQLKLVDTYDPKAWKRKHFDDQGNPVMDVLDDEVVPGIEKNLRDILNDFNTIVEDPGHVSRREHKRKRMNTAIAFNELCDR